MANRPKRLEVKRNLNNRFLHQTNLVCMSDNLCPALKGNLCLTKKLLFLTRSYGYTYKCRRQDVAERGKDAEVKRGAKQEAPFFYSFSLLELVSSVSKIPKLHLNVLIRFLELFLRALIKIKWLVRNTSLIRKFKFLR